MADGEEACLRATLLQRLAKPVDPHSILHDAAPSDEARGRSTSGRQNRWDRPSRDQGSKHQEEDSVNRDREREKRSAEAAAREERELLRLLPPAVQWDALLSADGQQELDALLFPSGAFIRAGSTQHREFGDFFAKYVTFRKKELSRASADRSRSHQGTSAGAGVGSESEGSKCGGAAASGEMFKRKLAQFTAELPLHYDQRYRINFAVLASRVRAPPTRALGEEEIKEAKRALLLFEDFRQRQTIAKIRKMRDSQRALPIFAFRDDIIAAVKREQVVLIAGDTGCGKSTQVPQYLIQAGFERVACTQPRRISTMSLCTRVATETLNEHGSQVAYQIRFESTRSERTKILFLTEGLLLRQLSADPLLEQYSVIIIDEVHERHLTGDLLLAVLRSLLKQRSDLRVILMSATINSKMFADYFGATVITVPGRLYPISLEYIPVEFDADGRPSAAQQAQLQQRKGSESGRKDAGIATTKLPGTKPKPFQAKPYLTLLQRIDDEYPQGERGDMLVFLSGMNEITALADMLRDYVAESRRWIVLKLHSSLPIEEQDRVFDLAPDGVRKCILSTNIAETSVTIDGIRFVVDSGKVKEMAFETDSAVHSLQEYWISKASANQRKGRAGRTGPGVCFRLYSQEQYDALLDFTTPEIHRVPLEATALQIKAMGLGDPRVFPWVEPPAASQINDAMQRLRQLQALSNDVDEEVLPLGAVLSALPSRSVLPLGAVLSALPVDLAIGKLLIFSTLFGLEDELMTIAAGLSIQSPFVRVDAGSSEATNRQQFVSEEGDPFTLLNVYDEWIRVKAARDNTKKWCQRHGVEEQRLYEMTRLKEQFAELLKAAGLLQVETITQARNRVARSNPDRSWKRKQLKKLQKERDLSKKTRVLDLDGGLAAERPEGEGGEGDAQAEGEVDLKALDFELSHDLSVMSDVCARDLTMRQVNLVKVALAASFHPNVALADAGNVNRRIDEAVFITPRKPLTAMHPTSVFGSSPSLIGPSDLVVYSQLLETTKAWVMNGTRCPLLATALMCASAIDTNRACSRILVDNWLEISVQGGGKLGEKMLYVTQQLRHALACCLASSLATCSHATVAETAEKAVRAQLAGDSSAGAGELEAAEPDLPELLASLREEVQRKSFVRVVELQAKVADLLEVSVKYSASLCARSKAMWQLLHPEVRGMGSSASAMRRAVEEAACVVLADGHIDAQKLQELKGGVYVCATLRFGSLYDGPVRAGGFASLLQHHTACSICQRPMLATLEELLQHEEHCTGPEVTGVQTETGRDGKGLEGGADGGLVGAGGG